MTTTRLACCAALALVVVDAWLVWVRPQPDVWRVLISVALAAYAAACLVQLRRREEAPDRGLNLVGGALLGLATQATPTWPAWTSDAGYLVAVGAYVGSVVVQRRTSARAAR